MADASSAIAVESESSAELIKLLRAEFLLDFGDTDNTPPQFGLYVSVFPAPDGWRIGIPEFKDEMLDEGRFYREFDLRPFKQFVDVSCKPPRPAQEFLHVVSCTIAKTISSRLGRRALVFLDGTRVPFRLYANGKVLDDFSRYSNESVKTLLWIPADRA